jgi:hypothetical protein
MYSTLPIKLQPFSLDGRPNLVELFPGRNSQSGQNVKTILCSDAAGSFFQRTPEGVFTVEYRGNNDINIAVYSCMNRATGNECYFAGSFAAFSQLNYTLPSMQVTDLRLVGTFPDYTNFVEAIQSGYIRVFASEHPTISYGILNCVFSIIGAYFINPTLWSGTLNLVSVCAILISIGLVTHLLVSGINYYWRYGQFPGFAQIQEIWETFRRAASLIIGVIVGNEIALAVMQAVPNFYTPHQVYLTPAIIGFVTVLVGLMGDMGSRFFSGRQITADTAMVGNYQFPSIPATSEQMLTTLSGNFSIATTLSYIYTAYSQWSVLRIMGTAFAGSSLGYLLLRGLLFDVVAMTIYQRNSNGDPSTDFTDPYDNCGTNLFDRFNSLLRCCCRWLTCCNSGYTGV